VVGSGRCVGDPARASTRLPLRPHVALRRRRYPRSAVVLARPPRRLTTGPLPAFGGTSPSQGVAILTLSSM